MKKECPQKYSLQITTLEQIQKYSNLKNVSFRQASFTAFHNLSKQKINCGFNLKTQQQFYSSLKRFKNSKIDKKHSKMNHPKSFFNQ